MTRNFFGPGSRTGFLTSSSSFKPFFALKEARKRKMREDGKEGENPRRTVKKNWKKIKNGKRVSFLCFDLLPVRSKIYADELFFAKTPVSQRSQNVML